MRRSLLIPVVLLASSLHGQTIAEDSLEKARLARSIRLSEVVVRSRLNVARFLEQIRNDTSFYKAFKNLRVLNFTSSNDIVMRNKQGQVQARLLSKTQQTRTGNCRTMKVLEEKATGNFYDNKRRYNYYTAELYASLFFTKGVVCGETNTIRSRQFSTRGLSGVSKHKEQLKMLLFKPGQRIQGVPLLGDKMDIFDSERARFYDFSIDYSEHRGEPCYLFSVSAKKGLSGFQRDQLVIDKMDTWFSIRTFEVLKRTYSMSYKAGVYDFSVSMEAEMARYGPWVVPVLLRYVGDWDLVFKKRERGLFTATIYDVH
jgi:hypothetical protein